MKWLKIVLPCLSLVLFGCNSGSRTSEPAPRAQKAGNGTCIPESELLAKNIVGGQLVQPGEYDSKLVVMTVSDQNICTAAPIARNILLTAAHCVPGTTGNTFVVFYSSLSCESGFNVSQHRKGVADIIVHPDYARNGEEPTADIALIVLSSDIPAGYPIYKIADPSRVSPDMDLFLYGYGKMEPGAGPNGAGMLRKARLAGQDFEILASEKKIKMNQSHGSGICPGDSGGPSLITIDNELQILGINSYITWDEDKKMCSDKGFQTLADSYRDWIEQKLTAHKMPR